VKSSGQILFREKQRFQLGTGRTIALAIPPAALALITLRQIVWHHPWGNPQMSSGGLLFLTILISLVFLRLVTVRLTTELRPAQLSIAMKGVWRRSRLPVAGILSAQPVTYDPIAEYGGYGVRPGPRGRAYIARGNRAVQLELRDGSKILLGSQCPDELVREIAEAQRLLATSRDPTPLTG
jgi:hypothetical protein